MASTEPDRGSALEVRLASRAIGRNGLAHAYGHCSTRLDKETFLVGPAVPMGLVAEGAACTVVPVHGPLPDGVLGEVRIHQAIYARRPDVGAIIRSQPPITMALSAMGRVPQPRHGFGCYLRPGPALWDDIQLLRNDDSAGELADTLGFANAIIMRGNGAVVAAESLPYAAVLTWYLEDAARIELEVLRCGLAESVPPIDDAAAASRAVWSGGIVERMWDYLTAADPERH